MTHLIDQLTSLRLHGMAEAAQDLLAQKSPPTLAEALRHLIQAEACEREIRSIRNRMRVARFPHHKDFATFDFEATPIDQTRIEQLAIGEFTHQAHNLILIGGTGTGKTHTAIALGTAMIQHGFKVRSIRAEMSDQVACFTADLLNDCVIPFFAAHKIGLLLVLTDRGTEYCGKGEYPKLCV